MAPGEHDDALLLELRNVGKKLDGMAAALQSFDRRLDEEERRRTEQIAKAAKASQKRADKERRQRRRSFGIGAVLVLALAAGGFIGFRSYTSNTCVAANRARSGLRQAFDSALVKIGTDIHANPKVLDPVRDDVRRTLLRDQPIRSCQGVLP